MKSFAIALGIAVTLLAAPALAVSGGRLGTLERGPWACEMPGDVAVARGVPVPAASFEITNDSTYETSDGYGTYLRTGDDVRITSGPRDGERYTVQSEHFLRKLGPDGKDSGLRCIKLGTAGVTGARPTGDCAKGQPAPGGDTDEPRLSLACDDSRRQAPAA